MCATLDAVLVVLDSDGNVVKTLASKKEYTVKENLMYLLSKYSTNETLVNLVNDLLVYGEAAQKYNGETENIVTDGIVTAPTDAVPTEVDNKKSITTAEGVTLTDTYFTAAGVFFDDVNKIYVKLAGNENTKLVVKVDGAVVDEFSYAEFETVGGAYICYTDGINATDFDTVYTFELYSGDVLVQTVTYSVNSYAYSKISSDNENMRALAYALYRYGVSAENYVPEEV